MTEAQQGTNMIKDTITPKEKRERFMQSSSAFLLLIDTRELYNHKVLMIKRANTGWMDGFYSVPAGGVEKMETPLEAARREAEEEVGVKVNARALRLAHFQHNLTEGDQWNGVYFAATEWQGEPMVQEPHKHSEVKWVPINNLPENTIPYVKQAIEGYRNNQPYSEYGWDKQLK